MTLSLISYSRNVMTEKQNYLRISHNKNTIINNIYCKISCTGLILPGTENTS